MDSIEPNPFESVSPELAPMDIRCSISSQLGAYHDGELDAPAITRVEKHLADCDACRDELSDIRELSVLAGQIGQGGMSASRVRAIHRMIDVEPGYSVLRIAGILTGLAASALIIGSVWLSEIPSPSAGPPRVVIVDTDSQAMQVAANLYVAPLPHSSWEVRDEPIYADARLADWMLSGLSERAR